MKIAIITIIYNKDIKNVDIVDKYLKQNDNTYSLYAVDNGTDKYGNREFCNNKSIDYTDNRGNKGLSKSYNEVISRLIDNYDYLIFTDDDTLIPNDFFAIYKSEATKGEDVYAPIVYGQDGVIYSPNSAGLFKNKLYTIGGLKNIKKFNAIMSCLMVKASLFVDYRFDESLFVDQVDQNLFDHFREIRTSNEIIKISINQKFHQREQYVDEVSGWKRFRIRINDLRRYYKKYHLLIRAISKAKIILLAFQLSKKSNSILILKNTIKELFNEGNISPISHTKS